jgi:hypothetical protein
MGRYYSGDIEGKFWFAVQSSNCADRFGSIGNEDFYIKYYFDTQHLSGVKKEIQNLEQFLGDKKEKLDRFFAERNGYTDSELKEIGISKQELSEYADLLMGYEIRNSIEDTGACSFTAEL